MALADAVRFVLSDGGEDCECQLADTVAGHVAAKIEHMQFDVSILCRLKGRERIGRRAKHAVQLRRDDRIALGYGLQQPRALRSLR